MAQHYPVNLAKEPQLKKSLERVGKYIANSYWLKSRKNFEKDSVYGKDIMSLSDEYKMKDNDDFVISISPYNLPHSKKDFGEFWKNALLEVHYDKKGKINAVYYPL